MNHNSDPSTSPYASPYTSPHNKASANCLPPTHPNLRDRFQGALLGLALTPIALGSMPGITSSLINGAAATDMANAIQAALLVNGYTHPWLSLLCMLLRYYDEAPEYRYKRLAIAAAGREAASHKEIAHQCLLGDVVSRALCGLPLTPGWLQGQQQQFATRTTGHHTIANAHPIVVGAASIATTWPSAHYSTCVPIAALSTSSINRSLSTGVMPTDVMPTEMTLNWEAALVAGLLAGAIGGRGSLPVLWQQQPTDVIAQATTLANTLFDQWTGRQINS